MLSEGGGTRTHIRVDQECHGTPLGRLALACWLDRRKTLVGFGKAVLPWKVQVRVAWQRLAEKTANSQRSSACDPQAMDRAQTAHLRSSQATSEHAS